MIQMNLQNRKRLTDLENELMAARGKVDIGTLETGLTHTRTTVYKIDNQQGPTA